MSKQILLFILLTLFLNIKPTPTTGQTFLKTFLENALDKTDIEIKPKCLGKVFERNLRQIKNYANQDQPIFILLTIAHIALDIYQQCPLDSIKEIYSKYKIKKSNSTLKEKLLTKLINTAKIIVPEMKNKHKTGESVGRALGKAINIFIRDGNPSTFRTLQATKQFDIELVVTVLGKMGFNEQCREEILNELMEISDYVSDVMEEEKNDLENAMKVIVDSLSMGGKVTKCNV